MSRNSLHRRAKDVETNYLVTDDGTSRYLPAWPRSQYSIAGGAMKKIRIEITKYRLDVSKDDEAKQYQEIKKRAKQLGYRLMDCISANHKHGWLDEFPSKGVVDTKFLFADQYNTETHRVHDWYESIVPNRSIKIGYYISGGNLKELATAKRNQLVCGYCGDRSGEQGQTFCKACLDSPYLKADDLHLLRLLPVADSNAKRAELTTAEQAELLPRYTKRQTEGSDSRNAQKLKKARQKLHDDYAKRIQSAEQERDGMLWLMDNGLSTENVIYYKHTQRFSFGWRTPVDSNVKSAILDKISEFPFLYEIKCNDGSTLRNE